MTAIDQSSDGEKAPGVGDSLRDGEAREQSEGAKPLGDLGQESVSAKVWFLSVVSAVVGYATVLLVATLVVLAITQWTALAIDLERPGGSELWPLPAHLVSMAVFGTLTFFTSTEVYGTIEISTVSATLIPLPLTIAMCFAIFLCTGRLAKRYRATARQTIALSMVTAVTLALLVNLVAGVFVGRVHNSSTLVTESMFSAGATTFLGAFGIAFATTWATWLAYSGIWRAWTQRFKLLASSAIRVASIHTVFLTGACGVVALVAVFAGGMFSGSQAPLPGDRLTTPIATAMFANLGPYGAVLGSFGALDDEQRVYPEPVIEDGIGPGDGLVVAIVPETGETFAVAVTDPDDTQSTVEISGGTTSSLFSGGILAYSLVESPGHCTPQSLSLSSQVLGPPFFWRHVGGMSRPR